MRRTESNKKLEGEGREKNVLCPVEYWLLVLYFVLWCCADDTNYASALLHSTRVPVQYHHHIVPTHRNTVPYSQKLIPPGSAPMDHHHYNPVPYSIHPHKCVPLSIPIPPRLIPFSSLLFSSLLVLNPPPPPPHPNIAVRYLYLNGSTITIPLPPRPE